MTALCLEVATNEPPRDARILPAHDTKKSCGPCVSSDGHLFVEVRNPLMMSRARLYGSGTWMSFTASRPRLGPGWRLYGGQRDLFSTLVSVQVSPG